MQYKINKVSVNGPVAWQSSYGPLLTYKVIFEGSTDVISINKKVDSPAPKAGDVLNGTIEENKFGKKFTVDSQQFPQANAAGGQSTASSYQPRDDNAIKAQFAIKASIQFATLSNLPSSVEDIEVYAKAFYNMVDRVKNGSDTPADDGAPTHDFPPEDLDEFGGLGEQNEDGF